MNDFRKPSRRSGRQAVDGILNAPSRQSERGSGGSSKTTRIVPGAISRTLGEFDKPEGYHPANSARVGGIPNISSARNKVMGIKIPSMLNMTLPDPQHGKEQKRGKKTSKQHHWWHTSVGKWSLRICLVFLLLSLGVGGFLGIKLYAQVHKVFKGGGSAVALQANVAPSQLKGEGDGRINILLTGIGGEGHAGADLTDTILLVSIDPVNKKAAMVSIPRDLWVTVDDSSYKINATYSYAKQKALSKNPKDKAGAEQAGIQKLESVVSGVVDMPIHYYARVDFQAFKQAVDTVGGVDINVPVDLTVTENLYDESTGKNYKLDVKAGQSHFEGTRALFFARSRHTSPRGDFDRTERQKLLIEALSQKILSAGTYSNPAKISGLLSAFGDHISTDMGVNDAVRLMQIGKDIGNMYESVDLNVAGKSVVTTGMISGQSVVLPLAGQGNYKDIRALVHSQMKDGYIVKENATLMVLNGTSVASLAATKADLLRYYGYNVGVVGSAPTQAYTQTVIVDRTGGKDPYTQNYLEKRFGVKAVTTLPDQAIQPGTANFIIIIGRN